uniref:Uncharacterized protein n=1 Tax=Daphnia galeata TaxID=27404 RepID=A0A8J2REE1_9CRUS|nr:unnamed protein product [Daphnia galeata]
MAGADEFFRLTGSSRAEAPRFCNKLDPPPLPVGLDDPTPPAAAPPPPVPTEVAAATETTAAAAADVATLP